jgi:hypothetical protein
MTHNITIAAIRMDASPAKLELRLDRAEALIVRAAQQDAQIAVLPELFNSGYIYSAQNYQRAEYLSGPTACWLKRSARKHNLYIAGSFLLREPDGIYNSMHLVAPDGRTWRYDKSCPWAFERAYFRRRTKPLHAAETELGKIGMLICADVSRVKLWAQYAGRVDLMLVSSCPPLVHQADFHLPNGRVIHTKELGYLSKIVYRNADKVFSEMYLNQAHWLGVPSVNTTGAGVFMSTLPRPVASLSSVFAFRPDLWKYIPQADQVTVTTGYYDDTFIADANGCVIAKTKINGDDLVVSTVQLREATPKPARPQPAFGLSASTYLLDGFVNTLMVSVYNKNWKKLMSSSFKGS